MIHVIRAQMSYYTINNIDTNELLRKVRKLKEPTKIIYLKSKIIFLKSKLLFRQRFYSFIIILNDKSLYSEKTILNDTIGLL